MAFILKIFVIFFCLMMTFLKDPAKIYDGVREKTLLTNASYWLKNFAKVTVTLVNESANQLLLFSFDAQNFTFELTPITRSASSLTSKDLRVNVDGEIKVLLEDDLNNIGIFEGVSETADQKYHAAVKFTREGVDCIVYSENDTFIIEPATRYLETNTLVPKQVKHQNKNCFETILYKRSDVINVGATLSFQYLHDIQKVFLSSKNTTRPKRQVVFRMPAQTECLLHLVADHVFYQNTGESDVQRTIAEMLYFVQHADRMFRETDFDGDGTGDNIGFHIADITLFTNRSSDLMSEATSVYEYLEYFSGKDFSAYCLATAFSSRDFAGGVVGLAWVASSDELGSAGGICQRSLRYNGQKWYLNTNLVTNINNAERLPSYVTALTLAHEFGHSFGSPHDTQNSHSCLGDETYGVFLMYPYLSKGNKPNNDMFSQCSINYIYPVLRKKGLCFRPTGESVCGNGLKEPGEECDCGNSEICSATDSCCTPSDVSSTDSDLPCTFRRSKGAVCSMRHSLCCNRNCTVVNSSAQKVCKSASDCTEESICDGVSADCPLSVHVPETTSCSRGSRSCKNGACVGSVCSTLDLEDCMCSESHICYVCCFYEINSTSQCLPYTSPTGEHFYLQIGSSCKSTEGFCDGNGVCITTDLPNTMDRFTEMFRVDHSKSVSGWMQAHWYYIVVVVLTVTCLVTVFILTFRRRQDLSSAAYMSGNFSRIHKEIQIQRAYLMRRKENVKARYVQKIKEIRNSQTEMDYVKAVARLMVFFPTTSSDMIERSIKQSASEESAVRFLLLQNQPFRRLC